MPVRTDREILDLLDRLLAGEEPVRQEGKTLRYPNAIDATSREA